MNFEADFQKQLVLPAACTYELLPIKKYHIRPFWQREEWGRKAIRLDPDVTFFLIKIEKTP
jgi:hypothetical protein